MQAMSGLLLLPMCVLTMRTARQQSQGNLFLEPSNPNLTPVGVVMNPGGTVAPAMYTIPMQLWQEEAEKQGLSMWITVLEYWFDLPLQYRFKANFQNAVVNMKEDGMPQNATMFFTGHSMGGGASQKEQMELYAEGAFKGVVLQASNIVRPNFPPMVDSFSYTAPTLTIGAELNFGYARITRMAEAFYRQFSMMDTHPVVMIEGMNHMQFAVGFEKEDIKPEISDEQARAIAAKLAVDWIAKLMGVRGAGALVAAKVSESEALLRPIMQAFMYEGARSFNVPNQIDTPGADCPRGVCPDGSQFVVDAQSFLIGEELMARRSPELKVKNNYADLLPFRLGEREDRKPFLDQQGAEIIAQGYVMAPEKESDYTRDMQIPVAVDQLNVKMISRQYAGKALSVSLPDDGDFCKQINQYIYDGMLEAASATARARFQKFGQPMKFLDTKYEVAGPLWFYSALQYTDNGATMDVKSTGLFTQPGDRAIDGNHYCKLLSPGRVMEWIYVDGLKKNLYAVWPTSAVSLVENACPIVETQPNFDFDAFISARWYAQMQMTIGYLPADSNNCVNAMYTKNSKPTFPWGWTVEVNNYARYDSGEPRPATLCAYNADESDPAKLAVAPCFLPRNLGGPYWVLSYSEEEGYALISGGQPTISTPNGCRTGTGTNDSGLWIFTRDRFASDELVAKVEQIAKEKGFDTSVLNRVRQDETCRGPGY